MRRRYLALIVALIIIVNAATTYGVVRWASPSGAQGPQGAQGAQGIPGPVATADVNTTLCAAALAANSGPYLSAEVVKYCPK